MLLFLLLVFLPVVPIETEVVRTLADCPGFFVKDTPPVILDILEGGNILDQNRYKVICQTFRNERRFLTLYDTENKIPVFSAYRFTGGAQGRPTGDIWKIEPQLIVGKKMTKFDDKNMKRLEDDKNLGNVEHYNQALNRDYMKNKSYDRGHLYPNSHAPDWDAKLSTFTLTNAIPQSSSFNRGRWNNIENETKCFMEKNCTNGSIEAFVVVAAEPGTAKLNGSINIPCRMWLSYCCYNSTMDKWLTKTYWENNEPKTCVDRKRPREEIKNDKEVSSSKKVQNVDSQGTLNLPFFQNSCEKRCESSRADLWSGG